MSITRRTLNEDTMSWMPVAEGFGMGASLIMMIGAQNAFVLQKGLQGQHRLPIALSCAMSDAILITLGVAGAGALILAHPTLLEVARWGGVAFLLSNLREAGAPIKRIENQSSGVIPVMKMLEDAFSYANQLGARQGAGAVYLHAHHPDI